MRIKKLTDRVKCITANNPGIMTGPGTNTYLIGKNDITVIDPGPASAEHVDDILVACDGRLKQILVTHTHMDHSPGAKLLNELTSAPVMGMTSTYKKNQDQSFRPDKTLLDKDQIKETEYTITTVHTPGHASNHLCFFLEEDKLIFTGDHIMNGSTVVIIPPDGNMRDYLSSLKSIKKLDLQFIAPGHGALMENPNKAIDWIIEHRLSREAKVIEALSMLSKANLDDLVKIVYRDVNKNLYTMAKYSLEAHLIKLECEGIVQYEKTDNTYIWLD